MLSNRQLQDFLAVCYPGSDKEHTFIETENVRYLFQPLEALYMVVITNKQSNIMEDLDTLHLLAKLVPEYCRALDVRK